MSGNDPFGPKKSNSDGVDIDFSDDDLDGWGEDDEEDAPAADGTDVTLAPSEPEEQPSEELVFVDKHTVIDDSHTKPTRRYQTGEIEQPQLDQAPPLQPEGGETFQALLDGVADGAALSAPPLQADLTVERPMAEMGLPDGAVPTTEEPAVEQPLADEPVAEEPVAEDAAPAQVEPARPSHETDVLITVGEPESAEQLESAAMPPEADAPLHDPEQTTPVADASATADDSGAMFEPPALDEDTLNLRLNEAFPETSGHIPVPPPTPVVDQAAEHEAPIGEAPVAEPDGAPEAISAMSTGDWDPERIMEAGEEPAQWSPVEVDAVVEEPGQAPAPPQEPDEPPAIEPLPLEGPLPEGEQTWLTDFQLFKQQTQLLARQGQWQEVAAVTGHALIHATFSDRLTRPGMLLDLARTYRDRLNDLARAEEAFALVARAEPANGEALAFLVERYQERAEWGAVFDLYMAAVEATWDPHERLSWTRQAASLATDRRDDVSLAIRAWEHLWRLGDAVTEASRELSLLYRQAGRWAEMAAFLTQQAELLDGPAKLVVLRELAEVKLSGLRDPDGASAVLEQIVERSPQDPIATLQLARVYTQRQDWTNLERLGERAASNEVEMTPEAAVDLQHLVAEALWQAGRLESAVAAYERILEVDPGDSLGTRRKQEYLTRTEQHRELLALLLAEADSTTDDEEQAQLLERAARLAEEQLDDLVQAAKLWERRVAVDAEHLASHEALARLYEALGELPGVARATEGQLALTKDVAHRVELYRKLGDHYASRMDEDDCAEVCWKEVLALEPGDLGAREQLIQLHRRRGDFEALNSALARQIWLTEDEELAIKLCRQAAENLDQNFDEPQRSVEAWRRVLDFAPHDVEALQALSGHYTTLQRRRDLIAVGEQEILALEQTADKVELALKVARWWEDEEGYRAAIGAYERVLCWDPTNEQALDRLVRTYQDQDQTGMAIGLLEHACTLEPDTEQRVALLRKVLELLPEDDHTGRFYLLRRVFLITGGAREVVEELKVEAEAAELWPEMTSVLSLLASREEDPDKTVSLLRETAGIFEQKLKDPQRAYLALQQVFLAPQSHGDLVDEVARLAGQTERHEDLLALLDRFTSPQFELEQRTKVIKQRATICEQDLGDGMRAFAEQRRLLELVPGDDEPLAELERLAEAHDLWGHLDAILAELFDRAEDEQDRLELVARRERIRRERLERQGDAFLLLVQRFRLAPDDEQVQRALAEEAEALELWSLLLPLQEAWARQADPSGDGVADSVLQLAGLYEDKLDDADRAFELTAAAFLNADPDGEDLCPRLEALADKQPDRFEALADVLRLGAAQSQSIEQTVELLRRIASIYEDKLDQPERAIGIYSRLLSLQSDDVAALDELVQWHRQREEWRDLRDRLRQRVSLLEEDDDQRVPLLLEIAQVSQEQLQDAEEALGVFGEVLELEPEHEQALAGLEGLVSAIDEPGPRLRWLQMQLKSAQPERAAELRLEIAQIQLDDLQDRDAAIDTLQQQVEQAGAEGKAYSELLLLLEQAERWGDLVLLLQNHADLAAAADNEQEMAATLERAMAICNEHLGEAAGDLWEDLYRSMLAVNPSDRRIRTHLARFYRQEGRFEELCTMLQENLAHSDPGDRTATRYEMARLQALNLDRLEDACSAWQEILADDPQQEAALLALARAALYLEDVETYVDYRRQQARMLPPHEAALVLCHLAEVAEENDEIKEQMVPLYREARTIDPNNVPAMEALKGIGRRLKNLRPAAALLPLDGERELSLADRALRLKALGDSGLDTDLVQAIEWYWRAVAVDPDNPEAWLALATALAEVPDLPEAFRARRAWLQVVQRLQPMSARELGQEAERLYDLARAATDAGLSEEFSLYVERAHDVAPTHAPSALARAQLLLEAGEMEEAHALLHTVLTHSVDDITEEQRLAALHNRGLTLRKLGRREEAMADVREVLALRPLHAEALTAMGEMLAESGRAAAAIEVQIRALTTVVAADERAELYYRLGVLWEDELEAVGEAGVCYELALAEGLEERDLLHRSLLHLQRTGRLDQSLEVVDRLLPTADDADELAMLWLVRGQIFAARDAQEAAAVEAFDMALSYDPARQEARDGLTMVLERQEDWDQLLQVLEATCDVGAAEQQSAALLRMAHISSDKLHDPDRAEEFLRRSVEVCPTRDALEQLEQIYTFESARLEQRKEVLGLLVAFGPPWFDRCLELSKLLLADDKAWAWCLLSPLLGVSQVDQDIKAVIQAMRKEFERPPILCPQGDDYPRLVHADADPELTAVLAELDQAVGPLGLDSLDQVGDGNAIPIGENTTMGKAFSAVAGAMGIEGSVLHRTGSLDDAVCVINCQPSPAVVVRTDVMQQLVHAEVGFLFAYVLELAKPGHRVMAAMDNAQRGQLLPALWQALGFDGGAGGELATRIEDGVDEQTRQGWAERLAGLATQDPAALGQRWWDGVCYTARRAGLLAGADLRQVFRVQSRLEEEVSRPRVVARMTELDDYVASSELLKDLVAFAASPAFGALMANASNASPK